MKFMEYTPADLNRGQTILTQVDSIKDGNACYC